MSTGQPPFTNSTLFDLYDFFSMFIPGSTLIIGLLPLLPTEAKLEPYGLAVIILILGYVVGRGVHSAAESADNFFGNPNHRDLFISALGTRQNDPTVGNLLDEFYRTVRRDLSIGDVPENRTDASSNVLGMMYVQARSVVHMDGRGRAKTFQATFAFYRSIHFVMISLATIYVFYSLVHYYDAVPRGIGVETYLGALNVSPSILAGISELLAGISLFTFHDAKSDHRQYYIQYLIQEYLLIVGESYRRFRDSLSRIPR